MYSTLLLAHSYNRYIVLLLLVVVIIKSFSAWRNRKPFDKSDDQWSLFLLIFTHLQLVVGLLLYFVSPWVKFGPDTMKDKFIRYWTVEHTTGMLIAIVLITIARISMKKMSSAEAKHKRLFVFNLLALIVILTIIFFSGRGLLKSTY